MSLVRFSNLLPSDIDRFFDGNLFDKAKMNFTHPSVNIKENENGFELELAAPGFDKSELKIEVDKDVLSIYSEKKEENAKKEENYSLKEFSYCAFRRSFVLPENVDSANIKASYEKGILTIGIPKHEGEAKSARTIDIE